MSIKSILVPVSAADVGEQALKAALAVARRFDAHIEALHVRADPKGLVPYAGEGMNGSMIEEIMEVTEREGDERATSTHKMFDAFVSGNGLSVKTEANDGGVSIAWREEIGREDEIVALRGRVADLTVVGRPVKEAALPSPITLEAALLETGRPILIVPPAGAAELPASIGVAWEGSMEAARAVEAALPMLQAAQSVTVVTGEESAAPMIPPEDLVQYLAWHGVKAAIHRFNPGTMEIGAALLGETMKVGANMMVKGAYSHSRLRQMILGGRTRHIISNCEIPVLLAR